MSIELLLILSSASLGVFLGAQLAEAVLILPYWKGMLPDDFFDFYKKYGSSLHKFYSPLTIIATVLPFTTFIYAFVNGYQVGLLMWGMLLFSLSFFSSYFVFFKSANTSFEERAFEDNMLPIKLRIWGNWHILEALAFGCSLLLLAGM